MRVATFIGPLNIRAVLTGLGILSQMLAAVLAIPVPIALYAGEYSQAAIFVSEALGAFILGKWAVPSPRGFDLEVREAFVITA
jgi:hypothetical protein